MKNESTPKIGLCLSGGGSRAIAFHLGCLRVLHKHGILSRVSLISTVSGGSVVGAMYAYSNDSFEEFTARVIQQLESGFQKKFAYTIAKSLSKVSSKASAKFEDFYHIYKVVFPFAVEELVSVFEKELYQGTKLSAETRDGIEIIINACELSTNTAFRFGNKVISNWVLGKAPANSVNLAEAVAISAAFPLLFSVMSKQFEFQKDGVKEKTEAFLTDGGVYENLGVTPLLPDRSAEYSYPHYNFDYIIACDSDHSRVLPRKPICRCPRKKRTPYRLLNISRIGVQSWLRSVQLVHKTPKRKRPYRWFNGTEKFRFL